VSGIYEERSWFLVYVCLHPEGIWKFRENKNCPECVLSEWTYSDSNDLDFANIYAKASPALACHQSEAPCISISSIFEKHEVSHNHHHQRTLANHEAYLVPHPILATHHRGRQGWPWHRWQSCTYRCHFSLLLWLMFYSPAFTLMFVSENPGCAEGRPTRIVHWELLWSTRGTRLLQCRMPEQR